MLHGAYFPMPVILLLILLILLSPQPTRSTAEFSNDESNAPNDNIPPIFLLNLDRAPHRWEAAKEEMSIHELQVHRLPAVDGRALSHSELQLNSTKLA